MFKDKFNNEDTQKALGAIVVIALVGFVGWYIMRDISPINPNKDGNNISEGKDIKGKVKGGNTEIKKIPIDLNLNADTLIRPKLDRTIVMPDRFSPEAITILRNNIATLKAQLKKDPNSPQAWSNLAIQYKIIDDFKGAIEIWKYLVEVVPNNSIAFYNLGNTYNLYLKDYKKSESYYKKAIEIEPTQSIYYRALYELYLYSYKTDTDSAEETLLDGLNAIPNNIDLTMVLAKYYKDTGRIEDAKTRYKEARIEAQKRKNTDLVNTINKELSGL